MTKPKPETWHGYTFEFCLEDPDTHSGVPIPAGWRVTLRGKWVGFFDADLQRAKKELLRELRKESQFWVRLCDDMQRDLEGAS